MLAAIDPGLVGILVTAVIGSGGLGAYGAYRKAKPEAEAITASTLIEVNEFLRKELKQRDDEIESLRSRLSKLRADFDALEAEFHKVASPSKSR